jgi:anthranilate phosphoribosyltransferase
MKKIFKELIENQELTEQSAFEALTSIGRGEVEEAQIAAFLGMYAFKGVMVEELGGFRNAMLSLANKIDLSDFDAMDVCGTGGDGKDTFNISTTAAFVVAGAGQNVAKHGNHGVSSAVGSSTVLEFLGVKFTNDESHLKQKLETAGICYMHAPLFHPAMRFVGPVRKALGLKTFMNILGPLLNPAGIQKQLTGTFDLKTAEIYNDFLSRTDMNYAVVHSLDGYDEISLTGQFVFKTREHSVVYNPEDFGYQTFMAEELHGGGTLEESAKTMQAILKNEGTKAQTKVVLANAAAALLAADPDLSTFDAALMAEESLKSGKAFEALKKLVD